VAGKPTALLLLSLRPATRQSSGSADLSIVNASLIRKKKEKSWNLRVTASVLKVSGRGERGAWGFLLRLWRERLSFRRAQENRDA